jgi:aminodeoxyfutalosine deaminase
MGIKPRLLIIAAPFGFGPAAKALILSHSLQESAGVTLCSDREAYQFICKHKASPSTCFQGVFSRTFENRRSLSGYDFFLSISNAPALQHLSQLGLAGRTIFLDSLLLWRASNEVIPTPEGLLAYLAEDHIGTAALLDQCSAPTVSLIAPLMWPLPVSVPSESRRGIVLHLGGITSPLAQWEDIAAPVSAIVTEVGHLAGRYGKQLTVIGSSHLKDLSLPMDNHTVLGSTSPEITAQLIAGAELVITTPGIGVVYEAIAKDTPVFLLPPMNSTQLHQYHVFAENSIPSAVPPNIAARLAESAMAATWDQQTHLCLVELCARPQAFVAELPILFKALLENPGHSAFRNQVMQNQHRISSSISQVNAVDIIKTLLTKASPSVQPALLDITLSNEKSLTEKPDLERYLQSLPKVELHVHMEGSIPPELLLQLALRNKIKLPFSHPDQFYQHCTYRNFRDFANILLLNVHCLRQLEDFFDVIVSMGKTMAQQNTRYAEITWTPQLYLNRGLPLDSILGAMNEARRKVSLRLGVEMRWIPDLVRSYPGPAMTITKWAGSASSQAGGVIALGLGGPEAGHSAIGFSDCFLQARSLGLPANPHAGEGMGPPSVWETIEHLKPSRLGHGVRSVEDPALLEYLARHALPLEVCLTSNIKLGIYNSYAEHPVKRLAEAGCKITLNSDDPVLFQTTLSREYLHAIRDCGLDLPFVKQSILDSLSFSYLDKDRKEAMSKELKEQFDSTPINAASLSLNILPQVNE